MKNKYSAEEPKGKPYPIVSRTSDLEFDFGAPVLPDHGALHSRWRTREVEEEHGLRSDVYRHIGLM
ncbi:MAG: hypothetical protein HY905_04095 [Deltaproteobacteria bacterium]|nr:hypothetical protein [Deltaproteobacteria bacterium]